MRPSTALPTDKTRSLCLWAALLVLALGFLSLFVGRFPLSLRGIFSGDALQVRVFLHLRLSRTVLAVTGGFALSLAGYVYQTVFRNSLASPDIIGVAGGAGVGAAAGILFLPGAVTLCAFFGAVTALLLALGLAAVDKTGKSRAVVLAGIAVQALCQTALMALKLTADPDGQLAAIEYWLMGSLAAVTPRHLYTTLPLCLLGGLLLFLLYRHMLLLGADEGEAKLLGLRVKQTRLAVLGLATVCVAAVISRTGLISFLGLLGPHTARLLTKKETPGTMLLGGLMGSALLLGADLLARSWGQAELPVSMFLSLLGAPFLVYLVLRRARHG